MIWKGGKKMNLRLFVFLALGALSSTASANWFDDYQPKALSEVFQPVVETVEMNHQATATAMAMATVVQSYPDASHLVVKHDSVLRTIVAPSFDVVAREMEQIKENQVSQEYALITYLQKNRVISVE